MKRALMPSGQAGMQLPLPLHTEAQRAASAVPLPPVIKSTMPPVISVASASASPAGATIGQARKHSPQRAGVGDRLAARSEVLEIPDFRADFGHAFTGGCWRPLPDSNRCCRREE